MRPSRRSALPASPARGGSTTTTPGGPEPPRARTPGGLRVDHDDVRRPGALEQLLDDLPDVAGEEGRVRDPVELRVLERAGDGFLRDLDPPDRQCVAREREPDRADPAVEIPDRLVAGEPGGLTRERVEPLGHRGVRL